MCKRFFHRNPIKTLKLKFKLLIIFLFLSLMSFFSIGYIQAKDLNDVVLGMSTALTGPSKDLGINMQTGVDTYIKFVNSKGGIQGRKIRLITYDDGYEPSKSAPNMLKLIKNDKVFAVIGNVGTPTAIPSIKISNIYQTPFFAPFTGAEILGKTPPDRWIFNYRASYAEETAKMIEILINAGIKPKEISFFIQDDSYGIAGLKGGLIALSKYGIRLNEVTIGRYKRNTADIDKGLNTILHAPIKPKAVIMVGTYNPCAKFIIQAKDKGLDAIFLNVSFVGSKMLSQKLAKKGAKYTKKVVLTQVVPYYNSNLPIIREYKNNLARYSPQSEPNFISLEGYIAAKLFVHICNTAGKNLTKKSFVDTSEKLKNYDLGFNYPLDFSKIEHQASHKVWITMLDTSGKSINYDERLLK